MTVVGDSTAVMETLNTVAAEGVIMSSMATVSVDSAEAVIYWGPTATASVDSVMVPMPPAMVAVESAGAVVADCWALMVMDSVILVSTVATMLTRTVNTMAKEAATADTVSILYMQIP